MRQADLIQVRHYGKEGQWIVLLHGGPGAPGDVAPLARGLQDRFQIMEPLQRRSGEIPLTVARHVFDLNNVLKTCLQSGKVSLVGHSWGAMLALTCAARFPEGIERVILIGCGAFDQASREVYQNSLEKCMDIEQQARVHVLNTQIAQEGDIRYRNKLFSEMGSIFTQVQSYNPFSTNPPELECDEAGFRETWKDAMFLQQQGIQPAEFSRIQAHVIMIHGDYDPHPGLSIYKSLYSVIPDIQYKAVPRCGHTPWIEREARDFFYEILLESLPVPDN